MGYLETTALLDPAVPKAAGIRDRKPHAKLVGVIATAICGSVICAVISIAVLLILTGGAHHEPSPALGDLLRCPRSHGLGRYSPRGVARVSKPRDQAMRANLAVGRIT